MTEIEQNRNNKEYWENELDRAMTTEQDLIQKIAEHIKFTHSRGDLPATCHKCMNLSVGFKSVKMAIQDIKREIKKYK